MADSDQNLSNDHLTLFIEALRTSLADQTFIKLSLGKSRGTDVARKLRVTLVVIQATTQLRFLYQYPTRDITEILNIEPGCAKLAALLGNQYLSGHLFSTASDLSLLYNKRGETTLTRVKATNPTLPSIDHNRKKNYVIELASDYLVLLGLAGASGQLKPTMASKFKQIHRFVEIVDDLICSSTLAASPTVRAIDIGSGKGYLTFALYDYLTKKLGKEAIITGIELRPELVAFCNQIADRLGFASLRFEAGYAHRADVGKVDIVIALHACDTATDDAIFLGVSAEAAVILSAPCCQHQIAPQLSKDHASLRGIHRFGLLKQRQADLVTDAARALLLESVGYRVKVIEFVSTEHTNKNLMLAAVRDSTVDRTAARGQYASLKKLFGFQHMQLESLLSASGQLAASDESQNHSLNID